MGEVFAIEDLLNTLIELERKGFHFYSLCEANSSDENLKTLFSGLAVAEKRHETFYENFKNKINNNSSKANWDSEYQDYINTLISNNFLLNNSNYKQKDLKEAFDMAEKLEKDTIIFLNELTSLIPQTAALKEILAEERSHLLRIYNYKKEYGVA